MIFVIKSVAYEIEPLRCQCSNVGGSLELHLLAYCLKFCKYFLLSKMLFIFFLALEANDVNVRFALLTYGFGAVQKADVLETKET